MSQLLLLHVLVILLQVATHKVQVYIDVCCVLPSGNLGSNQFHPFIPFEVEKLTDF